MVECYIDQEGNDIGSNEVEVNESRTSQKLNYLSHLNKIQ